MKLLNTVVLIVFEIAVTKSTELGFLDDVIRIDVEAKGFTEKLEKFWQSTGFCPNDVENNNFVLSHEEKINIALIGSLPKNGIKQIRIHWMLNLLQQINNETNSLDYSKLDELVDLLHKYELRPGFEIMGVPNKFMSISKKRTFWKNLVYKITKRYLKKYGVKYVKKWRFETWNEPDLKMYNVLNFTVTEYLDYINGCRDGLKQAFKDKGNGKQWKLGGPAGTFREKNHPLCWGLLKFCNDIPKRCPLQYISFHRKGNGTPEGLLNETLYLLDTIEKKYHNLKNLPVANDESDLEVTWSKALPWRADVRYAAMMVKTIIGFYELVQRQRKLKIELLSYDNGFLNYHPYYFTQRTLLTRFQINITRPTHAQFIKKPAYTVMGFLSYLENEVFMKKDVGCLSLFGTRSRGGKPFAVTVIVIYSNNTTTNKDQTKNVTLKFDNMPICNGKYSVYQLDNVNTNPYEVWQRMRNPVFPDIKQRELLRKAEGPIRPYSAVSSDQKFTVSLNLTLPAISLVHFCCKPNGVGPDEVYSVNIYNVTKNEILLTWKYKSNKNRCIKTFAIEFKSNNTLGFRRINVEDVIQNSFQFVTYEEQTASTTQISDSTRGYYRVKAIDYWDLAGNYSKIISYP